MNECSIKSCTKTTVGRGYCRLHYSRWRRHGNPLKIIRFKIYPRKCKFCKKLFKPKDHNSQIFCSKKCHYSSHKPKKCKIKSCDTLVDTYHGGGKGFCILHYRRFTRHGDPLKKVYDGNGYKAPNGYWYLSVNNKRIKRSRHVMEQHLKRKLLTTEVVHHINEDKLDDRIENLQIVSRSEHAIIHNQLKRNKLIRASC